VARGFSAPTLGGGWISREKRKRGDGPREKKSEKKRREKKKEMQGENRARTICQNPANGL